MRHNLLVMMLLCGACDKEEEPDSSSPTESDADADADADTDTDSDADADADTDADTDTNPLSVPVTEARYECGGLDTGAAAVLSVDVGTAAGSATVAHTGVTTGCCPTLDLTAIADPAASRVEMSYNLDKDLCDCICTIDLYYTVTDLPSGTWTVSAQGVEDEVVIP